MKFKKPAVLKVIKQLDVIIEKIKVEESKQEATLEGVAKQYRKSAQNLLHYNVLRTFDLREIQKHLKNWGLTRFSNDEAHIMASLQSTRYVLANLIGKDKGKSLKKTWSIKKGKRMLAKHTKELLGYRSKGRRVRIMVTQPNTAANDYDMVYQMIKQGMNCARINCAHDTPEVWEGIIKNVKEASKKLGKNVKIAMDLSGPKIRTGKMAPGPKIRKFKPERDVTGNIIKPSEILLVSSITPSSPINSLPISQEALRLLKKDDEFQFIDSRKKIRKLKIIDVSFTHVTSHCYDTSYIGTGCVLKCQNRTFKDVIIGDLPPVEQSIVLRKDDTLIITREDILGQPAIIDEDGALTKPGIISCQLPEVFDYIKSGEKILFDDGKIEGVIMEANETKFIVKITLAKDTGSNLKAYKGMNFPDTKLAISGLTKKDKMDLHFVAKHADIINFSFVNSPEDVKELYQELEKLNTLDKMDIILKIETKYAFNNLVSILLEAMKMQQVGVMIARGDLAVETGWDNIDNIQQEILAICGAAHIPVIWATQVLESLAKKGLPSRSEITDATTALKAECVMLNKGPYINEAIHLLHVILSKMEVSQDKKETMLSKMDVLTA
ncbi:pyruvate kinase [Flavivirga amylovorans]|uniref:pyruvate kinase n=1 Tax=Flavivirga amylovorans TaxID=870486 RepID=A0ABT8X0X6_9FLAO|nr:pyruvate kinase [Flavivirga amylovorans]MDO5987603.1 pyruvate kinase [Flavivirga amylovorans]